eukprot:6470944-Amphidinium_carterae.1
MSTLQAPCNPQLATHPFASQRWTENCWMYSLSKMSTTSATESRCTVGAADRLNLDTRTNMTLGSLNEQLAKVISKSFRFGPWPWGRKGIGAKTQQVILRAAELHTCMLCHCQHVALTTL